MKSSLPFTKFDLFFVVFILICIAILTNGFSQIPESKAKSYSYTPPQEDLCQQDEYFNQHVKKCLELKHQWDWFFTDREGR